MHHVNFEEISLEILSHNAEVLSLKDRHLYDSHILELVPILTKKERINHLDLSHNCITDLGAMLLVSLLKNTRKIVLNNNRISGRFLEELNKLTWSHNMQIILSDGRITKEILLDSCGHNKANGFNDINRLFNEFTEAIYQNPNSAKSFMTNFLLRCIGYWSAADIKGLTFEQVIVKKLIPDGLQQNKRATDVHHFLIIAVNYALEIERLMRVYKTMLLDKSKVTQAEELLLKELADIITSVDLTDLVMNEYYNSFDLICDIFDFFILKFNMDIDSSLFFGTSASWNQFLNTIRRYFIDHIRSAVDKNIFRNDDKPLIQYLKNSKCRMIFTLHRDISLRLIANFSTILAGRTQALIEIDDIIAELELGALSKVRPIKAAVENSRNICTDRNRLFSSPSIEPASKLLSAISLHDIAGIVQLLNAHNLIDYVDVDGWNLLHHWAASSKVDRDIFLLLTVRKPDMTAAPIAKTDWNTINVLIVNSAGTEAVKLEKLRLLLECKVEITHPDKIFGKLPIHYAAALNYERLVEALYQHNPAVITAIDQLGKTPRDYSPPNSTTQALLAHYKAPFSNNSEIEEVPLASLRK